MGKINWSELFPTKLSVVIFVSYMSLFVAQGLLVTASQGADNKYSYNTVTVVLMTEVLKLVVSAALYCRENTFPSLVDNVVKGAPVLGLYFVPAFLYCLYNNLAFINLSSFDPTTYFLLLQLRVVFTGVLFQIIFKKYLSRRQWTALILLTIGCMIKQLHVGATTTSDGGGTKSETATEQNSSGLSFHLSAGIILILVQTVCSCLAGVYNEYLLKRRGSDINIYIQNVFMYLDSIVCNAAILLLQGQLLSAFTADSVRQLLRLDVLIIMLNNAAIGICTSFFLKYMNSILKTFASAMELVFTAILSYLLFAIPIYLNTVLAIAIVSFAVYLYSQSPVINLAASDKLRLPVSHVEGKRLLEDRGEEYDEDDEVFELQMEKV